MIDPGGGVRVGVSFLSTDPPACSVKLLVSPARQ